MTRFRFRPALARARPRAGLALALLALAWPGCAYLPFREAPRPGRTTLVSPTLSVPARQVGNYLIVEAKWDRSGPYHFLIDTGSSVTLVTPELAARYPGENPPARSAPGVPVKSADGRTRLLAPAVIRRIALGGARFEEVPALVYDCADVSAHLGIRIDGILGFPLFRETILTLDYLRDRILLSRVSTTPLLPGVTIPFNNSNRIPLIPVDLGATTFIALVDSGRDAALRLNPAGLDVRFTAPPRPGGAVSSLAGDSEQSVARLAQSITLGAYEIERPLVEVTNEFSAIGGGILRNFAVTFDQEHNRVTFYRDLPGPVTFGPQRSVGLGFSKTPAYWRVAAVIPDTPNSDQGIEPGDLVTRINGEPVSQWDYVRYENLLMTAARISFTFLTGSREQERRLRVFPLVP